jgi:hypothetical protein
VIAELKQFLSNNFEMKDLGEANVILNIKISRDSDGGESRGEKGVGPYACGS